MKLVAMHMPEKLDNKTIHRCIVQMYFNLVSFPGPFQLLNTCSTGKQGGEGARYNQPQNEKAAFSMLLDQLHIHHIMNTTVAPC